MIKVGDISCNLFKKDSEAKKIKLLFPEMHFSLLKNKEPYLLLLEEEKNKFARTNLIVEIFLFVCVFSLK